MATTAVSIEEYLRTMYDPDVECIDGFLKERPVVYPVHGRLQAILVQWFGRFEDEWNVIASMEVRTHVSQTRMRLPEVVVTRPGPQGSALNELPLIVIEILSPTDRFTDVTEKVRDSIGMGIENIWLIDPQSRRCSVWRDASWRDVERFEVADSPIYVDMSQIFARYDKGNR